MNIFQNLAIFANMLKINKNMKGLITSESRQLNFEATGTEYSLLS